MSFLLPTLLGTYCGRRQLHWLAEQNWGQVASFAAFSLCGGVSGEPPLTIPSPSRVTTATTFCLLKRRSVCSSWRRPLAPWRPRLTVGCPQRSQSQPPALRASEHHSSPSRLPRVRDHLGRQRSDQCLLLNGCHLVCPLLQASRQKEHRSLPARLNSCLQRGVGTPEKPASGDFL